ncbi:hypothetical protein EVAR_55995_1 [Eumeta japonica]|uniref:Uncharacterized protein n=1 Tax=Eumeta variegata TaxID=151549 RepID=A0A4C1YUZ9_EUMVA|nr:hypothetical protein EVAR_55995_1 [Eumeta japonica]
MLAPQVCNIMSAYRWPSEGCVRPLSLFYSDTSADGVEERSLVPRSRSHARLRRNATMNHAFSTRHRLSTACFARRSVFEAHPFVATSPAEKERDVAAGILESFRFARRWPPGRKQLKNNLNDAAAPRPRPTRPIDKSRTVTDDDIVNSLVVINRCASRASRHPQPRAQFILKPSRNSFAEEPSKDIHRIVTRHRHLHATQAA